VAPRDQTKNYPNLVYWDTRAHDTIATRWVVLKLTKNVLNTYVGWKRKCCTICTSPLLIFMTTRVGDGRYNAWLDPILTDEWQMIGWKSFEMTNSECRVSFTHGTFDTWSPAI